MRIAVFAAWGAFGLYWLIAALGAGASVRNRRSLPPGLLLAIVFVLLRAFKVSPTVHSPVAQALGVALFLCGLAVAVWARVHLGRNWGMPMTERAEPELVTSGPYRYVRHPIYSGLLLAILGTGVAISFYWLIGLPVMALYFVYSARVEERRLALAFPTAYPPYRSATKMLIPLVF